MKGIIPQGKPWTRGRLVAPFRPKGRGILPCFSFTHSEMEPSRWSAPLASFGNKKVKHRAPCFPALLFFIPLSMLFLLNSCTGEAPELYELIHQIIAVEDTTLDIKYEELSLFLHVHDEDGVDDIEFIYLINDSEELFWELDSGIWSLQKSGDETWIGSNGIKMGDYSAIPRGSYRVILVDSAGERAETEIFLNRDEPMLSALMFPSITIVEELDEISIRSRYGRHSLWIYNDADELLKNAVVFAGIIPAGSVLDSDDLRESASYLYVYAYDEREGFGLKSGPYPLN